jgi:hypothetical protein
MILIRPGSAYPSDNYGWFEEQRSTRHLYVDRIAVSNAARGCGVGRALYEETLRLAAELGEERVTAEVNEDPPNPESMAFHAKLGFRHLESRMSGSGQGRCDAGASAVSDKTNLIAVAQITGAFGVKGEARVRSFTEDPKAAFSYGPLLDASGRGGADAGEASRPLNEGFGVTTGRRNSARNGKRCAARCCTLRARRCRRPDEDEGEVYVADSSA